MTATCFEGVSTNPEILAIADRISETVRLSLRRATNFLNDVPSHSLPAKGIERDAFDFLQKYQKINRGAVSRLGGLSRTGGRRIDITDTRLFGTLVNLDFTSKETVLEQAQSTNYFNGLKLSPKTLANMQWDSAAKKIIVPTDKKLYVQEILKAMAFKWIYPDSPASTAAAPPPPPAPARAKELHLKLARLKAIRRYGLEVTDWGNDSIACGGYGLDSIEQHVKAPEFFINTFKKDGESFNIIPDHTFVKFDLSRAGEWPRIFMADVYLAEKDASGGFVEFLQRLWDAIGPQVVALATQLALSAIGAAIGAAVLIEIPVIGSIVGAIVGAAIGYIVGWFIDTLKDDIFVSSDNPLGIALASQDSLFLGNARKSPTYTQDFSLGQSRYLMNYYWELVF
jgi:hypothetical protein